MDKILLAVLAVNTLLLLSTLTKGASKKSQSQAVTPKSQVNGISKLIVLDTSGVIDGRILKLAEAGFLNGVELISTNIILDELQYLADEGDSFKRSRARYGLEVLNSLSNVSNLELTTRNLPKSDFEVDQQLLNLSNELDAQLYTADFNLAQRARVEGVNILSPAELAEALKPEILPGEVFKIKLIQKGDEKNQATGYLPDGTMVVAENSGNLVGKTVELISSKIIQTTAGRIVFAKQLNAKSTRSNSTKQNSNTTKSKSRNSKPKTQPLPKVVASTAPVKSKPTNSNNKRRQNNYSSKSPKVKQEDDLIKAINNSNSTR